MKTDLLEFTDLDSGKPLSISAMTISSVFDNQKEKFNPEEGHFDHRVIVTGSGQYAQYFCVRESYKEIMDAISKV